MNFEWEPEKAERNLAKHGVTFAKPRPPSAIPLDHDPGPEAFDLTEERHVLFGMSERGRSWLWFHGPGGPLADQ